MNSEFFRLKELIRSASAMNPKMLDESDAAQLQEMTSTASDIAEIIKKNIRNKMLEFETNQQRTVFIRRHQHELIAMSNELAELNHFAISIGWQVTANKSDWEQMMIYMLKYMQDMLDFLYTTYTQFFDVTMEIPVSQLYYFFSITDQYYDNIQYYLSDKEMNERLKTLILMLAENRLDHMEDAPISFSQCATLIKFLDETEDIVSGEAPAQRQLHTLICSYNLNHIDVVQYCIDTIAAKVASATTPAGKIEKLALIRKRINQIPYKTNDAFIVTMPDIKQQLNTWIDEEMTYQEKCRSLGIDKDILQESELTGLSKIPIDLNLQAFAFMMNVAEATGLVKVTNKTSYMKTAALVYSTTNNQEIDPDTLRTLYYNNRMSAMEDVRDKMQDILSEISKRISKGKKK